LVQSFQKVLIKPPKNILEKKKLVSKAQNFVLISDLLTKLPKNHAQKVVSKIVSQKYTFWLLFTQCFFVFNFVTVSFFAVS